MSDQQAESQDKVSEAGEGSSCKEGVEFIQSAMGNNQRGLTRDVTIFVLFFKKGSLEKVDLLPV